MKIIIKNCNSIDYGEVQLVDKHLNMKYAINGTGKSTISKAIQGLVSDKLDELTPFKYYDEKTKGAMLDEHKPVVEIYNDGENIGDFVRANSPIQSVRVFDEEYVERYTLVGDDVVPNSFEIYVKTPDYDKKLEEIDSLIKDIKEFFSSNTDLDDIISRFNLFLAKIVKPGKRTATSTTSPLHKALNQGNKTINVPAELQGYQTFITSATGGKWAKWQLDGNEYFDWDGENAHCPYCSKDVETAHKPIIKKLSEEYSSTYLNDLKAVLEAFDGIKDFFIDSIIERIDMLGVSPIGFTQNENDLIKAICIRIEALLNRLQNARNIGFEALKSMDDIIPLLSDNIIDLEIYPELKSHKTETIVNGLNESLKKTIEKAQELKIAVEAQNKIIRDTIQKNETEINIFLLKAGYQYTVGIEEDTKTKKYRMLLKYRTGDVSIPEIKKHLSFGERNAFALVLFMYDVVREQPDLIILDDPISSFDKHKKYAIMDMLFCNDTTTLRGMTTLMLTHDFEPVSDALKTHCRSFTWKDEDGFKGQFVKAAFLRNDVNTANNTHLIEKPIFDCHVKNYIRVLQDNSKTASNIVSKLIYLRRLKEIEGDKSDVWDVLSCFFHKDTPTPKTYDKSVKKYVEIADDEITAAEINISDTINEPFNYSTEYPRFWNAQTMIEQYKSCTLGYEKLQLFRCLSELFGPSDSGMIDTVFAKFINETYHSEMEYILQLNPREFETVPFHILQQCNSKVLEFQGLIEPASILT
ncbi:hypothetical protein [Faecalispora jeddahensis]|uniref:hypothetical protein n=1 Tax=Faecalispora jeddahensis TaxID=1414721 RepID=UPI001897C3F5|nr:hypothetical protein [Faecalispora jeddahensis]